MDNQKTIYIKEWSKLSGEFIRKKHNITQLKKTDFDILNHLENKSLIV